MEYKHETFITDLADSYSDEILNETKEVYAKAKAFDAIVCIEDDLVRYHGFSPTAEEYAKEVKEIINEYEEDE